MKKYHIVWIIKYRKPIMTGIISKKVRELLRQICKENDVSLGKLIHLSPLFLFQP
ncbi:MAG: transposase [Bacteroidetes bacterium]|nr:transposase [Bacteroidota bacterium]